MAFLLHCSGLTCWRTPSCLPWWEWLLSAFVVLLSHRHWEVALWAARKTSWVLLLYYLLWISNNSIKNSLKWLNANIVVTGEATQEKFNRNSAITNQATQIFAYDNCKYWSMELMRAIIRYSVFLGSGSNPNKSLIYTSNFKLLLVCLG